MKIPITKKLMPLLSVVLILDACQKEISISNQEEIINRGNHNLRATGALADDPAVEATVPIIMSSDLYIAAAANSVRIRGFNVKKDTDHDGIPDLNDACPEQAETLNGYQDSDGCPDTVPPPTSTDTDGDGIPDVSDGCPSQIETFNGYQDTDGCPDTVPDTDGDDIADNIDGCPTEAETVNGYLDTDGCPDTPPVVLPPTTLPASVSLDMPPVAYQGGEGSCVAFAAGYAARSADQYYRTNATSYSNAINIFSPEFLYNQTKIGDCGSGTSMIKALEFMKSAGISTWQSMPYSYTNGCSLLPTSSQSAEAANFKITSYSAIYKSDITAIKNLLVNKHPLIIMVVLDESFPNAKPNFIWKSYSGSGGFNHALAICGYDDSKHAVKVMSSWGTGWGDAGYSWIDYDFLPQTGDVGAYVINP